MSKFFIEILHKINSTIVCIARLRKLVNVSWGYNIIQIRGIFLYLLRFFRYVTYKS